MEVHDPLELRDPDVLPLLRILRRPPTGRRLPPRVRDEVSVLHEQAHRVPPADAVARAGGGHLDDREPLRRPVHEVPELSEALVEDADPLDRRPVFAVHDLDEPVRLHRPQIFRNSLHGHPECLRDRPLHRVVPHRGLEEDEETRRFAEVAEELHRTVA